MIHEIHCRRCNRQLLEPTRLHDGRLDDVASIAPQLLFDEKTGRYCKRCPNCGMHNSFRLHHVPGRGMTLLAERLTN